MNQAELQQKATEITQLADSGNWKTSPRGLYWKRVFQNLPMSVETNNPDEVREGFQE